MQQIYWTCAILGSTIFLVQMVLTLIGIDASDVEVDFDGSDTLDLGGGLSLFSIRALINFLVGFGWSGVSLATAIGSQLVLAVVSILVGLFFAYIILMLYRRIRRLEHNGVSPSTPVLVSMPTAICASPVSVAVVERFR